jgi:hypothetical protein
MGFNELPQDEEYWSIKCSGFKDTINLVNEEEWIDNKGKMLESAKCGEKIFIEKWVLDVIVNYQKELDKDKNYEDLADLELKNEKGEVIPLQCPKCCYEVPYQWEDDEWGDWERDTPPHKLIRETVGLHFMDHYSLVRWTEELELDYSRGKYKLKNKLSQAENHERLLEFEHAAEIYKELGMDDEVIRIRKGARNKVDQTIIQGDYIDDRDTIIKDSVLNRTNVGASGEDKFAKLKELKEMFDSGFISKEEMEEMKKEILGK